jgi:serine/threonine protein kinase
MYIPPESFDGVITMAWDVWSCGILCYKLATRKIPYMFNDDEEVLRMKIQKGVINNYRNCCDIQIFPRSLRN